MGIGNNVTYIQTFEQHIVMLYSHFSANEWQILKGHSDKGRNNACYFFIYESSIAHLSATIDLKHKSQISVEYFK